MKNNKKLLSTVNHSLNNINNNVKKIVKNELVVNTIRVLLVVYASFVVPQLNESQLNVTNNVVLRLVLVICMWIINTSLN